MTTMPSPSGFRTRLASAVSAFRGASATVEKSEGYSLPISGGIIPRDWSWNWWQMGRDPLQSGANSTVMSCVSAYSQTIASLSCSHISNRPGAGKSEITTSSLSRVLREPNSYMTRTDWILRLVSDLLLTGNAYNVASRNERMEVASLHPLHPRSTRPMIEPESGELFYALGGNPMLGPEAVEALAPSRDVLHIKLYAPDHPLIGISPIRHLTGAIATSNAISSHQAAFFNRMARPSGVLRTDEKLTTDQMRQLRQAWEEQAAGLNAGGVPVLSAGLQWQALGVTSDDSEAIEAFRLTEAQIAQAFRIPLPIIGNTKDSNHNSVEQLISMWLSQGLGFVLEHVERSIDKFFKVGPQTQCEFNVDSLLRTDFQARIEGLTRGVQGGLFSPNEARRREGLPDAPYGDEPRVQQQVVPLSQVGRIPEAPPAPPAPPPAPQADERAASYESRLRKLIAA